MIPFRRLAAAALGALALAASAADPGTSLTRFPVQPAGRGAQRLDVPPAFVSASASGSLADLRLRDAAGREVPYLLVQPPDAAPRWIRAQRIRATAATKTESGAELDLGSGQDVSALEVQFARHGFLKPARLEGSADGARYTVLVESDQLYDLPLDADACGGDACGGTLVRRELRFPSARVRWLRLILDDRRSARLGLPVEARALSSTAAVPEGPITPLEIQPRPGEPGVSRFALRLPGPHLPVVAVRLEVDAPRLARRARVLEARLSSGRLVPFELGTGSLLRVERDGLVASSLRIPLSAPEETELELVVDDGDNPPLALRAASAELDPLPWIYFESADGAPVEATLGDPRLHAPRYDLEALRPELPRLHPAAAKAGAAVRALAGAESAGPEVADPVGPGAALDRRPFHEARPIAAAPPGLSAVALDAAVLARSDLTDLRLRGPDGRQIPYLLEARDEPLPVQLPRASTPSRARERLVRSGISVHALSLPQPRFPGSRLVLETSGRVFSRTVSVYLPTGAGREQHHHLRHEDDDGPDASLLASAAWTHADPGRPAPPLVVELPPFEGDQLLVTLDDGDNAPLAITSARLLLPGYRLRFFHPGPALELLYAAAVEAPRYDLELIAPRLRAAPARELPLLEAAAPTASTRAPAREPPRTARIVFWVILGVAVAALLALVARLVVRGTPPDNQSGDPSS